MSNYYLLDFDMNATRQHLPSDVRRAVTVRAVVDLAATQNPGDITTMAIARHMGVTQGALFKHFPTKEAILQAVMEWVAAQLLARIDDAAVSAPTAAAALEAMFLAHADFVAENPGVPRMLFGELQRAEETGPKRVVQGIVQDYGRRLRRVIDAGKRSKELPSSLDSAAAVTLIVGALQGLVMQSLLAGDERRIRRDAPRIFAICLRGLRGAR